MCHNQFSHINLPFDIFLFCFSSFFTSIITPESVLFSFLTYAKISEKKLIMLTTRMTEIKPWNGQERNEQEKIINENKEDINNKTRNESMDLNPHHWSCPPDQT